jgi:UDP-N-acetylmuramoyl-tripeptide--D-alanyl-D-alanine ligase
MNHLFHSLHNLLAAGAAVSTDTRNLPSGCLFFALRGERYDANLFAEEALQAGAAAVVTERKDLEGKRGYFIVEDSLVALQQFSAFHRNTLRIPVLAIGGSNGKTTTKELVGAVLQKKYNTAVTKGNLNNHIGVPLTLLSITNEHEFAVVEIGANHLLETAFLSELAQPDYGLVTNNGKDHLEGFGNLEGVKKANAELFDWLKTNGGEAFVNADDADLMAESAGLKRITYGKSNGANMQGEPTEGSVFSEVRLADGTQIRSSLFGQYNFPNLMAAITIGKCFGVPDEDIVSAITDYRPGLNRSQVSKVGSNTVIFDCYNANPSSMKAAIESFVQMKSDNPVLVLADMLEMGEHAASEHKAMLDFIDATGIKRVILTGTEFKKADSENKYIVFDQTAETKQWLQKNPIENSTILLKGSRGYKLEQLFVG